MLHIYKIDSDTGPYMYFAVDSSDVYKKMKDFDVSGFTHPLKFNWVAPEALFLKSDTGSEELPDITIWGVRLPVIRKSALALFESVLGDDVVEVYPLSGNYSDYVLLNPVQRMESDIMDLGKTRSSYYEDGSWNEIEKLVLKSSATESAPTLFTLDYENGIYLYCTDSFKETVDKHQLKGLRFEEVELS